ncbi:hypothetical protein COY27_02770 [Candidatus Woesearchaeota archaeon CG_4_10_14_0_2_um_filter_33_13]|nr:MAG: hypothetical protein COY27_02770 [Candidatus Woesearchaeota archaeon CG_4_10_14_0_2_um_filter_33_13]
MPWLIILQSLYFFLPAYIANMAPVLFKWLPILNRPVWEKGLGTNKTWRGLVAATLVGGLVFSLQKLFHNTGFVQLSLINYSDFSVLLGFLLGFGAIAGDAVKSYYKRKIGIAPGKPWMPFDQLDFVIGGLAVSFFFYVPPVSIIIVLLLFSPFLHIIVNHFGYWLKINKSRF